MRAVLLREFTHSPGTLNSSEVETPAPGPGEALVQTEAAAINPSDLLNIRGGFAHTVLPRVIGRDFAGRVTVGPPHLRGREVWGAGGDLGYTHDGTHAEFVAVPEDGVALRPSNLSAPEAASAGIPFITAWCGLVDRARIKRGDWVIVSGAAGSVGSAAVQISWYVGAHVIALIKDAGERELIDQQKIAAVAQSDKNDLQEVVREATDGDGAAIALNTVGSLVFASLLASLADRGRMIVVSGVAGREVERLDLMNLYRRDLELIGLNTANLSLEECAKILAELYAPFESGAFTPPRVTATYSLDQAQEAYARAAHGSNEKIVFEP